jgi:hypothetical protein
MTSAGVSVLARIISHVCHITHEYGKQNFQQKTLETSIPP